MLRIREDIVAGDIELFSSNAMQEHIDPAEGVVGYVYVLSVKPDGDVILAEHFCSLE